jgi:hypothetical protein
LNTVAAAINNGTFFVASHDLSNQPFDGFARAFFNSARAGYTSVSTKNLAAFNQYENSKYVPKARAGKIQTDNAGRRGQACEEEGRSF